MLNAVLTILILAPFVYLGFITVKGYMAATGDTWARLKAAFKNSATIAWARLNALSVLALSGLTTVTDWIGLPGLKDALVPYLTPTWMTVYTIVVLIGAEIARRRTL